MTGPGRGADRVVAIDVGTQSVRAMVVGPDGVRALGGYALSAIERSPRYRQIETAMLGEDIFIAIASILLIQGVFESAGYPLTPLQLSVWAIPTALCAFVIHASRIRAFDRRLGRAAK